MVWAGEGAVWGWLAGVSICGLERETYSLLWCLHAVAADEWF